MTRTWAPPKAVDAIGSCFERADALAISALFAVGALVYGVFIFSLGFYWDDWPVVWVFNALGSRGVANYIAGNRPVTGWIYATLAPILGMSPIGWQVVALAVRCASSAILYVAFCALWPKRKDLAWLLAMLVLLYPGFTQQPIAVSYLSQHLSFLLFVVSLTTTIFSITVPDYRWLSLPVSVITEGLSYLIIEYFAGLELFRLFVIVVLSSRDTWNLKKLRTALIAWSPYATVWTAYIVWRVSVLRVVSPDEKARVMDIGSDLSKFLSSPIHEASIRFLGAIQNILTATILAWARPFSPDLIKLDSRSAILSWAIAAIVIGIAIYMLRRLTSSTRRVALEPSDDEVRRFPRSVLTLGVLGLGVAGLPFVVSGLVATFTTHPSFEDRFTLSFMLPASLILSSFLMCFGRTRLSRELLVSLVLFAFSVFQIKNSNLYRHDWLTQKTLFWQIAWRAPALKQGTSLFADDLPVSLYGNHSAGLLNLLYNRDDGAGRLNYFIFDLSELSIEKLSWEGVNLSYRPGDPIVGRLRSFQFQGNTDQSLVSWISPSGTFRIVTQPYANEILRGSALCISLSYLSRPGEVIDDAPGLPAGPLLKIFGSEPKHEWLYFYQKAELERQLRDWDAVAMLGDEVIKQGYNPTDPSEWFPFIEGYARTHRYRRAVDISNRVLEESPDGLPALSSLWLRVKSDDLQNSAELNTALGVLGDKLMLQNGQ